MAGKLGRLTGRSSDYWLRASFARDGIAGKSAGRPPASDEQPDARPFGVGVLVNHQIVRAVNDGVLDIDPFIEANVQLASIDLTLDDFVITTEGEKLDISDGHSFILKGGRTVNVGTRESIEFPRDYIGRVGAMTSLAKIGIMTSHGFQVDPGFQGNLQFCIFNAGGQDFELHSGMPIISLEIMPLSVTPTHDERAARHLRLAADRGSVISLFKANVCDRLIRDAIRDRANVDLVNGGAEAKISGLGIEIADDSADAALGGAVERALDGLKTLREHPGAARDERGRYQEFFSEIAERLYLTADQARQAVSCLGFSVDNSDTLIVALRDGKEALLSLPTKSGKISLRHLARQLREEPAELILLLAGSHRYVDPES
jgi:deoxycytidine triphosphate deaminase